MPIAACASLFAAAVVGCSSDDGSSGGGGNGDGGTGAGNASTGGDGNPGSGGAGNASTGGDGNPGSGGDGNPGTGGTGGGGDGAMGGVVPGTDHYDCSAPTGALPTLKLVEYATGFDSPLLVTHAPNDTERLFVVEQPGVIRVVKGGTTTASPFLDISARVSFGGNSGGTTWEQGLLGLAFHPDYDENGLFYVHYNSTGVAGHPDGSAIIAEFKVSGDNQDVADGSSERIVLSAPTSNGFHNGGTIAFGADGMLYIALGDGGSEPNGQDVTNVRAGVSRINPVQSGADPYTVPTGNLSESVTSAAPELWSYGLRNPYRFNFDACTGDMYIGDVGQSTWEEINVEPAGEGHRNYGWPTMEGPDCYQPASGCDESGITPPTVSYGRPAPQEFRSVTGGAVYRGSAIPALRGTYFYSDLYIGTSKFVYDSATGDVSDHVSVEDQLNPAQSDQALVAIQTGGDGELYFVSRGGSGTNPGQVPPGVVYRLEAGD